ncbi:HAMP domain-containing sensor histidine kinase [Caldinitratiruptor microaerophilus]|uniref:histidine kinase n=1 Tax=Caldinitratiruptor microaerophilus TaxID=671077 RepID=A0AA35G964_9FIRM|nr:cell wall metabolism sensor histidine kinase WalK [Caldinitratiruptor microaerophilus]BDG61820.1 PAS domain-containing sensor histidine kinase [Caldinitratiruptor microaerophilus]
MSRLFRSLQARLVLAYLLLVLVAMELTGVFLLGSLESYYLNSFRTTLSAQAQLLGGMAIAHLAPAGGVGPDRQAIANLVANWPAETGISVAILGSDGEVLGASRRQAALVGQRLQTDEISHALGGSVGELVARDPETGERTMVRATPLFSGGRVVGVVYLKGSLERSDEVLRNIRRLVLVATGIALAVSAVLGTALARTITGPVRELTAKATAMAQGQFDQSIPVRSGDEVGRLAETFNFLAGRLKETLAEISGERQKLETILAYMADGLVALDREGRIIKVNPAAARLLGADPGTLTGLRPAEAWPDSPVAELLERARTQGESGSLELRPQGERGPVLVAEATPLRGEGDAPAGAVLVLHDITELQRLDQMRRDFVANVSHELKTPLTTVKSYVETLLDGAAEDPELRTRFLGVVEAETDRMVRLVRDLLQLSQLDQGTLQLDLQPVSLPELVEGVLARLSPAWSRRRLAVEWEWAPDLPLCLADRDRLEQVVLNIVANAVEFTPEGGSIRLWAGPDPGGAPGSPGSYVRLTVKDTGIGIPAEDLPRIFERFYRVDKARARTLGGTGLGLAIAKQIVEALGGDIRIASEVGKGTEVTVLLPVAEEAADEEGPAETERGATAG